jgi:hypothetical protein
LSKKPKERATALNICREKRKQVVNEKKKKKEKHKRVKHRARYAYEKKNTPNN